ncbi:MAG: hypothetical protein M3280_02015 [Actinomycetota bacterium]|nr:hypothetical protein [Actinomycetota bacterium]
MDASDPNRLIYTDRSQRGKLRFGDQQRAWFLDQILTQSFEDMRPGETRDSALLTVHGRMQAYLEATATSEFILCHFEPELRESLPETLRRYVFATRVTIDDVTDEMGLILVAGKEVAAHTRDLSHVLALHPTTCLGTEAVYVWVDSSEVPSVLSKMSEKGGTRASEDELERLRIANGVPRWGRDMDEKTFPQEAGVDAWAVHYEKGCYLGQEAMAKIHFRGKVNRRLRRLQVAGDVTPGEEVFAGENRIGLVTSAADGTALAMLKYTAEPGTKVRAGRAAATIVA